MEFMSRWRVDEIAESRHAGLRKVRNRSVLPARARSETGRDLFRAIIRSVAALTSRIMIRLPGALDKWIADDQPAEAAAVLQVFAVENVALRRERRRDDQGIVE